MTLADYSLAAFALLNGGRAVAYVPQMVRVYRDPHGAAAVSLVTWLLFAAANIATVCYALAAAQDHVVAIVFGFNAAGCLAIVALIAAKRMERPRRLGTARIAALRESAALVVAPGAHDAGRRESPSARARDEMIRQGLMS